VHTDDDHEILCSQLLDPDFDFIMFLYNEKWKIEDQLHTENHPIRVRKREDRKHDEDEKFANLPPMTPLSRCESPELRTGDDRRIDLPHTFRMFLWRCHTSKMFIINMKASQLDNILFIHISRHLINKRPRG
jgi:hypothetical protein